MSTFITTLEKFNNATHTPSVVKHLKSNYGETDFSLAKNYLTSLQDHGSRVYDLLNTLLSIETNITNDTIPDTYQTKNLEYWFKKVIRERYRNSWKKVA